MTRDTVPLDTNSNLTLPTLIEALVDDIEVAERSESAPTEGRALKDPSDGSVYVGDGSQWLAASSALGLDTPAVAVDTGSASDPAVALGDGGAGLFVNGSGEIVAVDEAGNTTVLS